MEERTHSVATMAVLVGLCLFGLFLGVRAVTEPFPDAPLSSDDGEICTLVDVRQGDRIRAKDVLVSVFNASNEGGLARNTLRQLGERGFGAGIEGNVDAPRVKFAEVWADTEEDPAALLVARQFGPRVRVVTGEDTTIGPGVVVVVGENFEQLARPLRFVRAAYDTQVCSPNLT